MTFEKQDFGDISIRYPINNKEVISSLQKYVDFAQSCFPVDIGNNYAMLNAPHFKEFGNSTLKVLENEFEKYGFALTQVSDNHYEITIGSGPKGPLAQLRAQEREMKLAEIRRRKNLESLL